MSKAPRAVTSAEQKADKLQEEFIASLNRPEDDAQPPAADPPELPATPPNDSPPASPEDDWEHRYKVLQGKYDAEVPRLSKDNSELNTRLGQLKREVAKAKEAPPTPLVSPEEVEEYGEGLIDVARRIAREEVATKQGEIDYLKTQLDSIQQNTANTAKGQFFQSLDAFAPAWKQINEDPLFIEWLSEIEPFAGVSRQSLIADAEQTRDAKRVARFFNTYAEANLTVQTDADASLQRQVAPPKTRAPNTPPAKRVWRRAEIADFYGRVKRGEVTDAEAIAIEADITAASIEGRVR